MSLRQSQGRRDRQARIDQAKRDHGRAGWNDLLTEPLALADGTELRTLADARAMMAVRVTGPRELRNEWQRAAGLLLDAAGTGEYADRKAVTDQLRLALFLNAWLKL